VELQKLPVIVIVVDSVNEKLTDNPPDLAAKLPPPPPAEFEVAAIKPSNTGTTNSARLSLAHGRVDLENVPLKELIMFAWDLHSDKLLAEAPKLLDSARYDIAAKAPPSASGNEIDPEDLRLMLRALLVERFNMKTHMEDRPVEGYVLTAVKPKLQKADPSNRSECKNGPGPDGKDPRVTNPVLNRLISCQNTTMPQFAEALRALAGGYVQDAVLDSTELTGAYDFILSFSGINLIQGGYLSPGRPASEGAASEPSGALSLPDAVSRQLGLKLELKKHPMPVLVIDHVDEKPADN
jgi:uncharacterized protein (TIGR03435 family)